MGKKSKQRTGFRHRAEVSRNRAPVIGMGFARLERFFGSTTPARLGVPHGGRL
jgi:hypothetical protein